MGLLVRLSFTHSALWSVFVSICGTWSGQSDEVPLFGPIRSQIVQKLRIFPRCTLGVWPVRPRVFLLTSEVTNRSGDMNFPTVYGFTLNVNEPLDWFLSRNSASLSQNLSHLSHWYLSTQVIVVFAKMLSSACSSSSSVAHSLDLKSNFETVP